MLLKTEYEKILKYYFVLWEHFKEKDKQHKLRKKQIMHTDIMQQTIESKANHEDQLF